jgi:WD40 repeat protein
MNLTKHWAAALDDYVIDLAWSPDGDLLAAASSAGPVWLFASADGAKRHLLPGHDGGTNAVAFAPAFQKTEDGGRTAEAPIQNPEPRTQNPILATGGQDGAVKFWDAAAGQHVATANLGSAWVEHLAWAVGRVIPNAPGSAEDPERRVRDNPPYLAAAAGRNLTLLNADASVRHTFSPSPRTITALAWGPPSALRPPASAPVLAVAYFGGVCLWNAGDFSAAKEFAYNNGIHALVWSPDGKWLVSGNQDPSVHLWVPAENDELHMSGYETKVKHLSFDHGSRWLATGGGRDACIWDCAGAGPEGREPAMLPHDAPVCAVAFQNTHGLLATASQDGVVMLWSPERKQPLRATVKMPAAATKLLWSPDDRFLAIGSEKGAVYVLRAE